MNKLLKGNIWAVILFSFSLSNIYSQEKPTPEKTSVAASANKKSKEHIVVKGETWYSIAKRYKISNTDLRTVNKQHAEILHAGDTLIIPMAPVAKQNSEQKKEKNSAQPAVKSDNKIHTVKPKENLSAIARKYQVTVAQIVEWNKLTSKSLKVGEKLIVGTGEMKSAESVSSRVEPIAIKTADTVAMVSSQGQANGIQVERQKDSLVVAPPKSPEAIVPERKVDVTFAKGRKEITEEGAAAWIEDQEISPGKYFALHRSAPIGTIVKVTNRMNRRVVFVKVVGKLPDTGENANILLKISKAAAEKLGVLDARFQAQLNYGITEQ